MALYLKLAARTVFLSTCINQLGARNHLRGTCRHCIYQQFFVDSKKLCDETGKRSREKNETSSCSPPFLLLYLSIAGQDIELLDNRHLRCRHLGNLNLARCVDRSPGCGNIGGGEIGRKKKRKLKAERSRKKKSLTWGDLPQRKQPDNHSSYAR